MADDLAAVEAAEAVACGFHGINGDEAGDDKEHDDGVCHCHEGTVLRQTLDEMDFNRGIWMAAVNGATERVEMLLDRDSADVNERDANGYTALHYAARNGHIDICRLLLRRGAFVNVGTKGTASTALHRAAYTGRLEIVRLLLASGADPATADVDGATAVHKAAQGGHRDVVAVLLKHSRGAAGNVADHKGRMPADVAKDAATAAAFN